MQIYCTLCNLLAIDKDWRGLYNELIAGENAVPACKSRALQGNIRAGARGKL